MRRRTQAMLLSLAALMPVECFAAGDFTRSIENLVNSVLTKILPAIALFYVGEAALNWMQSRPDAKERAGRVAVGAIALLGINGVWSWLSSQVR